MPNIRKHLAQLIAALILTAAGAACNMPLSGTAPPASTPASTPQPPTSAPAAPGPPPPPAASATPEPVATPTVSPLRPAQEEAILILEPGPGSRIRMAS